MLTLMPCCLIIFLYTSPDEAATSPTITCVLAFTISLGISTVHIRANVIVSDGQLIVQTNDYS